MIESFYHRVRSPWVYQDSENNLVIRFRISKKFPIKAHILSHRYETGLRVYQEFEQIGSNELFFYYQTKINSIQKRFRYVIEIKTPDQTFIFGERGLLQDEAKYFHEGHGFTYANLNPDNTFYVPKWFRQTNWFQIFPDRFNKSTESSSFSQWHSNQTSNEDFFGGDLRGIINKLNYIQQLGFNGIYLTPIFTAKTIHRYDTIDYYQIDERLGTEEDFKDLITEAHKRGMKIMVDGVFNHIGWESKQWLDVLEHRQKSIYKDWFYINDFNDLKKPSEYQQTGYNFNMIFPYETFGAVPEMPKLNLSNPEVEKFLFLAIEKWTKMGIDGWRLDVAFEPTFNFWRKFKNVVHKINKEIVIIGEIWWDSINYLQGDMFTGVMNYPLREIILDLFVRNDSISNFLNKINNVNISFYTPLMNNGMLNLLSSHDVARFYVLINQDQRKYQVALVLLYFMQGSISIYYGQEIGLEGGADPDNRRGMDWKRAEQPQFKDFFVKLNHLKLEYINKCQNDAVIKTNETTTGFEMEYKNEGLKLIYHKNESSIAILFHEKVLIKI